MPPCLPHFWRRLSIHPLRYANRAKNIKMRVEPNKKLVSQHISAYKNIIADLRGEIDKLKSQLQHDMAKKANPLLTKHAGMYPRARQQTADGEPGAATDRLQVAAQLSDGLGPKGEMGGMVSPGRNDFQEKFTVVQSQLANGCQCAARERDEEEKETVMAEIHLTYEEILQLEQALIEVDEQNTINTLEIRKREAKMIFIMKQVEEIEDILMSKEN